MPNALVALNAQLDQYRPRLADILPPGTLPVAKLIQTIVYSCEQTPKLLECSRDSLFQAALTAANLGLPVDGVTGQGYLIPRRNKGQWRAQFQPGYKGLITLAARARWILSADLIRENDPYRIVRGTEPKIEHDIVHALPADRGRPIFAYAVARSNDFPPASWPMSMPEVYAVRDMSDAYKSDQGYSPWKSKNPIVQQSMVLKVPMIQLGKRLPLAFEVNKAAVIDERADHMNQFAWIDDGGQVVVEGEAYPPEQAESDKSLSERLDEAR